MFVQTLNNTKSNSLKFLPGEKVSLSGPIEFTEKTKQKRAYKKYIVNKWCIRSFSF